MQLAHNLGLSRDAVSLAWSAQFLCRAGKTTSALRTYQKALELACRQDYLEGVDLGFNDDQNVRRYFLPGERTSLAIVRGLVSENHWTFRDWSDGLPRNPVAILAAARVLRERAQPEAEHLLKRLVEQEELALSGHDQSAILLAARAEAYALLTEWKDAEQRYRQAIDLIGDATIKRSWWFNLASVAVQLDDDTQRRAALDAAFDTHTDDDISRRAFELQRSSHLLGRLPSMGTKAN
jgi:tetratricopeptide (TPR) repeat protein